MSEQGLTGLHILLHSPSRCQPLFTRYLQNLLFRKYGPSWRKLLVRTTLQGLQIQSDHKQAQTSVCMGTVPSRKEISNAHRTPPSRTLILSIPLSLSRSHIRRDVKIWWDWLTSTYANPMETSPWSLDLILHMAIALRGRRFLSSGLGLCQIRKEMEPPSSRGSVSKKMM